MEIHWQTLHVENVVFGNFPLPLKDLITNGGEYVPTHIAQLFCTVGYYTSAVCESRSSLARSKILIIGNLFYCGGIICGIFASELSRVFRFVIAIANLD